MLDAHTELAALAERFWQFQRFEFPLNALLAGQPNDDPTMWREAPEDFDRRAQQAAAMLGELAAIPIAGLPAQDRATHRLLQRELDDLRSAHATLSHLKPWLLPVGPEFNTIYFANSSAIGNAAQAERYVDRLASVPAYFAGVQACLRAGLQAGVRVPRVVLAGALANLRDAAEGAADSTPWYGPFKRSPAAAQPAVLRQAERASQLIAQHILPALQALRDCVALELLPQARDSIACSDDPQGAAFYGFWARHFTTSETLTPQAIHELGLAEVARLEAEITGVAAQAGYANDVAGYRDFLAHDPQFVCASAETLRERCEVVAKRIDAKLPAYFGRLPRISCGAHAAGLCPTQPGRRLSRRRVLGQRPARKMPQLHACAAGFARRLAGPFDAHRADARDDRAADVSARQLHQVHGFSGRLGAVLRNAGHRDGAL
jgi:uncharacterized protein (DUF885 family)